MPVVSPLLASHVPLPFAMLLISNQDPPLSCCEPCFHFASQWNSRCPPDTLVLSLSLCLCLLRTEYNSAFSAPPCPNSAKPVAFLCLPLTVLLI